MPPSDGFSWLPAAPGRALVCDALAPLATHLFTTRGWMLGSPSDNGSPRAWQQVAEALGVDSTHLVRVRQVHGASVCVRHASEAQSSSGTGPLPEADIIVSEDSRLVLAIQTADCLPILIADRGTGAVGVAHAGWRGLAARATHAAVETMGREFGSRPRDLVVAIGPSISAPRYQVGADVRDRFERAGFPSTHLSRWFSEADRVGHWLLDLRQAAGDQLKAAGVPAAQIHVARLCTATDGNLLCSYRRDGPAAGRMAAAIRRKPVAA